MPFYFYLFINKSLYMSIITEQIELRSHVQSKYVFILLVAIVTTFISVWRICSGGRFAICVNLYLLIRHEGQAVCAPQSSLPLVSRCNFLQTLFRRWCRSSLKLTIRGCHQKPPAHFNLCCLKLIIRVFLRQQQLCQVVSSCCNNTSTRTWLLI